MKRENGTTWMDIGALCLWLCHQPRGQAATGGAHLQWNFPSFLWGCPLPLSPYTYPAHRYQVNRIPFQLFWKKQLVMALSLTPQAVAPGSPPSSRQGGMEVGGRPGVSPSGLNADSLRALAKFPPLWNRNKKAYFISCGGAYVRYYMPSADFVPEKKNEINKSWLLWWLSVPGEPS